VGQAEALDPRLRLEDARQIGIDGIEPAHHQLEHPLARRHPIELARR